MQKYNNVIVNSVMDEILMHKNQKVSASKEVPENIDSDFDENGIYHIESMSLDDIKEKLTWHKRAF